MRHLRHFAPLPDADRGCVVALGNFDGVHCGHRAVIATAAAIARGEAGPGETGVSTRSLAVLTFEPHPRSLFRPDDPPFRLTPFRMKSHLIEQLGVDLLFTLHFDATLASYPAETFIERVLVEGLGAAHVVVGYDFVFGARRSGNSALLERLGPARGRFGLTVVSPAVGDSGEVFSATRIRECLTAGDPPGARRLLGRPWEIEGRIEQGDQRGRTIGFPTANVALADHLRPALGVYAVRAGLAEEGRTVWHDAVANIGWRPTVGGKDVRLEVHLFDFARDLYGRHLRVAFVDFIRPERAFAGLDALKAQIAADAAEARTRLAAEPGLAPP